MSWAYLRISEARQLEETKGDAGSGSSREVERIYTRGTLGQSVVYFTAGEMGISWTESSRKVTTYN